MARASTRLAATCSSGSICDAELYEHGLIGHASRLPCLSPHSNPVQAMIRVTFLGTAAARPTVRRNVSGISVQREGELMLFDCGEGTQRQMMRYGTGFGLWGIFITHLHADHFVGVIGLLRTMALQGHTEQLTLGCPAGGAAVLREAAHLGLARIQFPIEIQELEPGDVIHRGDYEVRAFRVNHGTPAVGYVLSEDDRLGRFDVARARALGVPDGPDFGRLHRGEPVEVDGRVIRPEEVVGPSRRGRTVAYTGDTRPAPSTVEAAAGAELLIHDATFTEDEADRARATYHSTAAEAARTAREADVERLALTHLSARYSDNASPLEKEAREIFPSAIVASDGLSLEIPYADRPTSSTDAVEREVAI